MRFYDNDGIEMDVQDPKFFIDEDLLQAKLEAIEEILTYADSMRIPDYGMTV